MLSEVATVPEAWFVAVAAFIVHSFDDVVLGIAVGEAVGHEHIKHVGIVESLTFFACHRAVEQ